MSSRFSRRFFQRLWHFNAIVIAAVALMGLGYGTLNGQYITSDILRAPNVAGIAPVTPAEDASRQPESGSVAQLETLSIPRLPDLDVMYAAMTSVDHMSVSQYSKEATNTHDYLFYDMKTGAFRRLIGRDDSLVAQMTFLSAPTGQDAPMIAGRPVALLMTVVECDSGGDGRLSAKDLKMVAMAGPTGVRLTTAAREVKQLVGHTVGTDGAAVIMVRDKDDVVHAMRISIPDFAVTQDDTSAPGGSGRAERRSARAAAAARFPGRIWTSCRAVKRCSGPHFDVRQLRLRFSSASGLSRIRCLFAQSSHEAH